ATCFLREASVLPLPAPRSRGDRHDAGTQQQQRCRFGRRSADGHPHVVDRGVAFDLTPARDEREAADTRRRDDPEVNARAQVVDARLVWGIAPLTSVAPNESYTRNVPGTNPAMSMSNVVRLAPNPAPNLMSTSASPNWTPSLSSIQSPSGLFPRPWPTP